VELLYVLWQACQLPMFEYMAEKMAALCYERAWYTKLGGSVLQCCGQFSLFMNYSLAIILNWIQVFIAKLIFINIYSKSRQL